MYGPLLAAAAIDLWLYRPLKKLIKDGEKCRKGKGK